jgi:parallel beta-helix repeat protein
MLLAVCLVFSGCAILSPSGTADKPLELGGVLQGTTVVSGHVLVARDILVPVGSELIVKAGAVVLVRNSESTKIDPEYLSPQTEILVRGRLLVDGSSDSMVTFMPEQPVAGGETAWAGIIIDGSTDSAIRHARIHQPDTGILLINASPDIIGNKISRARYGIVVQGGNARILDNEITLGEGGIFCWNQSQPYLKGNLIVANDEEGVVVSRGSKPYLDRNTISGNGIGLVVPHGVPYDPTGIIGNREDIRLLTKEGAAQ